MGTSIQKPAKAKKIKILKRELVEFWDDEDERKRLGREASAIERRHKKLKAAWIGYVDQQCPEGQARRVELFGFELSVEQKQKRPDYRAALARQIGEAAVQKLEADAEFYDSLNVRRAA